MLPRPRTKSRPTGFHETSLSIPRGKLQIETGFSLEREVWTSTPRTTPNCSCASVIPTVAWSEVETSIDESSADAVFGLIFTWARDVNERWSLGGVLGPVWPTRLPTGSSAWGRRTEPRTSA
jgi:hypothetical protein